MLLQWHHECRRKGKLSDREATSIVLQLGRMDAVPEGPSTKEAHVTRTLAAELGLSYMPDLQFYYDESFDYGDHIDRLLKSIRTENGSDNTVFDT